MNTITIDATRMTQRTRYINGKPRVDTYVAARCTCGFEWFVRRDNVKRTQQCKQCAIIAAAKAGYAATAEKYGERFALRFWREWRLEHPTCLERIVAAWLDSLGIDYEREYWFETHEGDVCLIDFMVNGGQFAIEANGEHWHGLPGAAQRDARKAAALVYADIPLIVLSEKDIFYGQGYDYLRSLLPTQ